MVKMNDEEAKRMLFFQQVTGAATRDCIDDGEWLVFVVAGGEVGAAVGRRGANIATLEKLLKRRVMVVEHADTVEKFAENIFFPTKVKTALIGERLVVNVDANDRKYVVGKGGYRIKLAKTLLKRHFNINEIKVD